MDWYVVPTCVNLLYFGFDFICELSVFMVRPSSPKTRVNAVKIGECALMERQFREGRDTSE